MVETVSLCISSSCAVTRNRRAVYACLALLPVEFPTLSKHSKYMYVDDVCLMSQGRDNINEIHVCFSPTPVGGNVVHVV